jgi:hypothetical protein
MTCHHKKYTDGSCFCESVKLYRFWNPYFDERNVRQLFLPVDFTHITSVKSLPEGDELYMTTVLYSMS